MRGAKAPKIGMVSGMRTNTFGDAESKPSPGTVEGEDLLDRIDMVCEAFEDAWQRGERPEIAPYLSDWQGADRQALFQHLVELDIDYRGRTGEPRSMADLLPQFPEYQSLLRDLITKHEAVINTVRLGEQSTVGPGKKAKPTSTETASLGRLRDYDLLEEIGRGGMGIVFRARQRALNRVVALKVIRAGELADSQEVARFHAEAQAAAHLDHPGIVAVHDVGEEEGQHYFSMAYVPGQSLAQRLAEGPVSSSRPSTGSSRSPAPSTMPMTGASSIATSSPATS